MFSKKLFFLFLLCIGFAGCKMYTPQQQILPEYIKKIAIRPFLNKTSQLGLEDKLYVKIYDEFLHDGRYLITSEEEADGVLVGEITHYILQPISYGANFEIQQYKLRILINIYFIDKKQDVTLWSQPNLEGMTVFYVSTQPGGMTEADAREIIWENLSKKIFTRTVEGYGSVTGISNKKIPPKQVE